MIEIENEGYRAQAQGKDMVADNPYCPVAESEKHWAWRRGFLQAFVNSN